MRFLRFLAFRLLKMVAVVLAIVVVNFLLIHAAPGDRFFDDCGAGEGAVLHAEDEIVVVAHGRGAGCLEILADGLFGTLVPVGDVAGLAAALLQALDTPGDPALRVARAAEYDTDRVVGAYLDLFGRGSRSIPK